MQAPHHRRRQPSRAVFVALLAALYGTAAFATFVTAPPILGPLMSVPPNRYVVPASALLTVANGVSFFASFWWAFAVLFIGLAFLAWKGTLDRLIRPLACAILLLCLAAVGLVFTRNSLPASVERTHGPEIRRAIFE